MGRSYIHLAVQERALIETQLRLGMSPVAILWTRVLFVPLCEHCSLPPFDFASKSTRSQEPTWLSHQPFLRR